MNEIENVIWWARKVAATPSDGPSHKLALCHLNDALQAHDAVAWKSTLTEITATLQAKCEMFAKYHTELAGFGGASQEFHERVASFLLGDVHTLLRDLNVAMADVQRQKDIVARMKEGLQAIEA